MRAEVVRYLDFMADKHTQNSRMVVGKHQEERELSIAGALTAAATDFRFAQIVRDHHP